MSAPVYRALEAVYHGSIHDATLQYFGARRSRRLATPSCTSGPAKPMNSSASEVSKLGPAWRYQLLSDYLVQRMAVVLPAASLSATS